MNLGLVKSGIQLVTGFGAGLIADNALKIVAPTAVKGLKGVAVKAGSVVLSMMVADKASDYVETIWNKAATDIKEVLKPKEKVTEETEEA